VAYPWDSDSWVISGKLASKVSPDTNPATQAAGLRGRRSEKASKTQEKQSSEISLTVCHKIRLIDISSMFGQLSKTFTLLSALFVANLTHATAAKKDFDWDIQPREGFPTVAFNNTKNAEIVFLYDVPLLYENKTSRVTVMEDDCETIGSNAITHLEYASVDRELKVMVDVDQETISGSTYYQAINITNAVIGVCLRVDYLLNGASVNFHVTNLTIDLDLTAEFILNNFQQLRIQSEQDRVNANFDFPIVVYHCDEVNDQLARRPVLAQGTALQMCVELDPVVNNENVFVVDILSVDLHQEKMDLNVTHKNVIDETIPNPLTSKLCEGGICNIKTQLDSSWFSDDIPGEIETTGTAILAFGSLSDGQGQRFLRAPIVFRPRRHVHGGSELDRELQQGGEANELATFTLATLLKIPSEDDKKQQVLFICVIILVALLGCCCFGISARLICIWRKKRLAFAEEGEIIDKAELESAATDDEKFGQAEEGEIVPELDLTHTDVDITQTDEDSASCLASWTSFFDKQEATESGATDPPADPPGMEVTKSEAKADPPEQ
jgi:hypothetical protein